MLLSRLIFVSLLLMFPLAAQAQNADNTPENQRPTIKVRLMTWNIRYANKGDEEAGHGWPKRAPQIFDLVKAHNPDVLCVQEALASQMDELSKSLFDYDHYGIGRDDAKRAGEFAAVFYKRDRFEALENQTVWLSSTSDVPSKGWDAALPRIATRVRLRDRVTKTQFDAWSTHFDHMGKQARLESANLLRNRVAVATVPVLVAGDLNTEPSDPGYPAMIADGTLRDARMNSESTPTGSTGTFCGWERPLTAWGPIDYIFVSAPVRVEGYTVSTRGYEEANISDHLPVIADLSVETQK